MGRPDSGSEASNERWEQWLAERPPQIRSLARRFPPGTMLETHGGALYVVAYAEEKGTGTAVLEVSTVDPTVDYDRAVATRRCLCPCCGPHVKVN